MEKTVTNPKPNEPAPVSITPPAEGEVVVNQETSRFHGLPKGSFEVVAVLSDLSAYLIKTDGQEETRFRRDFVKLTDGEERVQAVITRLKKERDERAQNYRVANVNA